MTTTYKASRFYAQPSSAGNWICRAFAGDYSEAIVQADIDRGGDFTPFWITPDTIGRLTDSERAEYDAFRRMCASHSRRWTS